MKSKSRGFAEQGVVKGVVCLSLPAEMSSKFSQSAQIRFKRSKDNVKNFRRITYPICSLFFNPSNPNKSKNDANLSEKYNFELFGAPPPHPEGPTRTQISCYGVYMKKRAISAHVCQALVKPLSLSTPPLTSFNQKVYILVEILRSYMLLHIFS